MVVRVAEAKSWNSGNLQRHPSKEDIHRNSERRQAAWDQGYHEEGFWGWAERVQNRMNALEQCAFDNVLGPSCNEAQLMDLLQGSGVVSDNCSWLKNVSEADHKKAIAWMAQHLQTDDRS